MDLTNLRDSLDSSSRERHPASASAKRSELRLTRDFKAAALQLTTLYRTSLSSSKRSYAAGYAQSLADILDVVQLRMRQSPLTAPGSRARDGSTFAQDAEREELHWLVRYLRARLEAIKAESDEDEDNELSEDDEEPTATSTRSREPHVTAGTQQAVQQASVSDMQQDDVRSRRRAASASRSSPAVTEAPAAVFTFTAPPAPRATASTAANSRSRRGRTAASAQAHAEATQTPPRLLRSTSSDEDEAAHTPTPRHMLRRSASNTPQSAASSAVVSPASASAAPAAAVATRLGKRRNGRERVSNLELFGRAMTAKRRRHMGGGDRRDGEDRPSPTL